MPGELNIDLSRDVKHTQKLYYIPKLNFYNLTEVVEAIESSI